ncbi:glycoside hydrolase family 43 protein [Mucilaginibacter auburnensis]|uniref:Beta-xylosidase n=1 Tax=Mucilaginibacter auburnensis TaxID=1457233 RepID=A0A2H9VRV5_9SPHI|nr:glycoside hydrolase 43 family protein [Mucilaginibacter auburnensis]PJJ83567.1 beta-xylosidase [Mucilaginibacter auburnensis]
MNTLFKRFVCVIALAIGANYPSLAQTKPEPLPVVFADVPDLAMIRVGDTYYMSSTTMHMNPGLPIMKSKDLVNWQMVGYVYQTLGDNDDLNLVGKKNAYGKGSWASSLRYHNGTFYVTTFSSTTGKTYIFTTKNIEKGPWVEHSFKPSLHDHSLFFDDDGKIYLAYGTGKINLVELKEDLSGIKPETQQIIVQNASAPAGTNINLQAEGSQLLKHDGKYYLFNITWPRGGMRTEVIHRADKITGPWEGKLGFQHLGVAQGSIIDNAKGDWFAYLFRDYGSVGRAPYILPVKWENGWPIIGDNGKFPADLKLPVSKGLMPGLVNSDEFTRKKGEAALPLAWQWNHNPVNDKWSVTARPGYLRLTTGRIDSNVLQARNTLTQRTFGPTSSATTAMDVTNMKDGDVAGLLLLQKRYEWVGVKATATGKAIVVGDGQGATEVEAANIPINQKVVYFKADCDFTNRVDKAWLYYSLDGKTWTPIGNMLKMSYTLPHFMGYRFGLFNYATKTTGGYVDFDYLRLSDKITAKQ